VQADGPDTQLPRKERCGHWERVVIEDEACWTYWCGGTCQGMFRAGKWYESTDGTADSFSEISSTPPAGLSPPEAEPTDDWNKGVDSWKFDRRNRYWINGVEVSRAKAYASVADPAGLVDDSDKYHLSFVLDCSPQLRIARHPHQQQFGSMQHHTRHQQDL
jgi:hypothetical protein